MISRSLFRFCVTGVINTSLSYSIFVVIFVFSDNYKLSNVLSYLIVICVSFVLNKGFVFSNRDTVNVRLFLKFVLINIASMTCGLLLVTLFVDYIGINPYVSQIISLIFVAIINYLGYKTIFKVGLFYADKK